MPNFYTTTTADSLLTIATDNDTDWRDIADVNGLTPFLPLPIDTTILIPTQSELQTLAQTAIAEGITEGITQIDWLY